MEVFPRLSFVPNSVEAALGMVETGRDITQHQAEFWTRYAQIEETYSTSLLALLALPCSTWESPQGYFAKKKVLVESSVPLAEGWQAVKSSVRQVAEQHAQLAESLSQQGHLPLDAFLQQTADDVAEIRDQMLAVPSAMETAYKSLLKSRGAYVKLAQSQKGSFRVGKEELWLTDHD